MDGGNGFDGSGISRSALKCQYTTKQDTATANAASPVRIRHRLDCKLKKKKRQYILSLLSAQVIINTIILTRGEIAMTFVIEIKLVFEY